METSGERLVSMHNMSTRDNAVLTVVKRILQGPHKIHAAINRPVTRFLQAAHWAFLSLPDNRYSWLKLFLGGCVAAGGRGPVVCGGIANGKVVLLHPRGDERSAATGACERNTYVSFE